MSQYVTIKGSDLDYFKSIVREGLSGSYGDLNEVRIAVGERGMTIGANGHSSAHFGTVESDSEPRYKTEAFVTEDGANDTRRVPANEPEKLGDIMRRMFPGERWNLNVGSE